MRWIRLLWILLPVSYTAFKGIQLFPQQSVIAAVSAFVLFFWMLLPLVFHRLFATWTHGWGRFFYWGSVGIMGWWSTFILIALPMDLLLWVWSFFRSSPLPIREVAQWIFAGSFVMTIVGYVQTRLGPCIKKVQIPIENLPAALSGLKIVQISDLHVSPTIREKYVSKVVSQINAQNPDIVLMTGDLADETGEFLRLQLRPFKNIQSRQGVYFVTGNHEYYWGVEEQLKIVQEVGMIPLVNENRVLKIHDEKVLLAGVPDLQGGQFRKNHEVDLPRALSSSEKVGLKILLSHRPDLYGKAEQMGVNILFSGHTHAGQFFPASLVIPFVHKFYKGLKHFGKLWVYVNQGTGYWGPPNRLGVSGEVTSVTLLSV